MSTIPNFQSWQNKGRYVTVDNHKVFVIEEGKADQDLVVLHGYPTFSYDYWRVLPYLSQFYRVIIHDHLGFGLSDKPMNYSYSLIDQADVAIAIWKQLGVEHAHLVAHDYGTSIATEMIARRNQGVEPIKLQSLTLCNGSMHIELAKLRLIQKALLHKRLGSFIAKLSTEYIFVRNMKNLWSNPNLITKEELNIMWQMLNYNNGRAVLPQITQYLNERYQFWHRWIGGLQKSDLPTNILWATEDPVAVKKMGEVLHHEIPNSQLQWLNQLGHYPMIEDARTWAKALHAMIGSLADNS